jgi:hypothetical protein
MFFRPLFVFCSYFVAITYNIYTLRQCRNILYTLSEYLLLKEERD